MEPGQFIQDIKTLLHGEHPPMFVNIPRNYQEDFKSWVSEVKHQEWHGIWERVWFMYNREYIYYIINTYIQENTH